MMGKPRSFVPNFRKQGQPVLCDAGGVRDGLGWKSGARDDREQAAVCFGLLKTIALLRKVRHRGLLKVDWVFTFACAAFNLVRLRNLSVQLA